jgi:hypothetical protein
MAFPVLACCVFDFVRHPTWRECNGNLHQFGAAGQSFDRKSCARLGIRRACLPRCSTSLSLATPSIVASTLPGAGCPSAFADVGSLTGITQRLKLVALYHAAPTAPTERDLDLAALLTGTAARFVDRRTLGTRLPPGR